MKLMADLTRSVNTKTNHSLKQMGRPAKRQRASAPADMQIPEPKLCCLPHCEAPGCELDCGHSLCGLDFLKITKYSARAGIFISTCPMCRKEQIQPSSRIATRLDEMPFKCAVFNCPCPNPQCKTFCMAVLRPCKSHKDYNCDACAASGGNGSYMHLACDSGNTWDWSQPGWSMTDAEFLIALAGFRETRGVLSDADVIRLTEARRVGSEPFPEG